MKTRQKKKNLTQPSESEQANVFKRSLSHLTRSVQQFSEGLQDRLHTVQEHVIVEPLESAAWSISQRVRKIQSRVFDFIDERVSAIEEARNKKLDHQTALERFDGEGGAMQANHQDQEGSDSQPDFATQQKPTASASKPTVTSNTRGPSLDLGLQH